MPVTTGAQRVVNVVGRVRDPESVESLVYSLNDGPAHPIFFKCGEATAERLALPGDFNIDTIERADLEASNHLVVTASLRDGGREETTWRFPARFVQDQPAAFRLDLDGVDHPQEVAQVVDGHWRVAGDGRERWLEIAEEDNGLDRIILFGRDDLERGYTVRARVLVTSWIGSFHNIGLLFHWNPHVQGDGTLLPPRWNTGLGYYYSHCPGLRIRVGVDVHVNEDGVKVGDHVLAEAVRSPWRHWASRLARRFVGSKPLFPQVSSGVPYWFELHVGQDRYALTVWECRRSKPSPQLVVENPPHLLERGAAGIIAHRCGARVYEFEVEPD